MLLLGGCARQGNGLDAGPNDAPPPAITTEISPPPPIDIIGVWQPESADDSLPIVGDRPALTPAGRKLAEARRNAAARGDRSWDGTLRCLPPGTPRILLMGQPLEINADPHVIAMLFQYQRLVRMIYMDDAYPVDPNATFMGESHGRWEGDVLVVETGNFKTGLALEGSGLPLGAGSSLVERFEHVADDTLIDHITIRDPELYQRPWEAQVTLRRRADLQVKEDICAERAGTRP
jgi:hypothetical protein